MKTLIVIDMQKDFIDGSLGTPEAVMTVSNVKAKIAAYRANGDEVIFTRDTHGADYMETSEGKQLPVVHCVKGDGRLGNSGGAGHSGMRAYRQAFLRLDKVGYRRGKRQKGRPAAL